MKETKFKIHFIDNGQDFLEWHIDELGNVIHVEPFQSEIWKDSVVDPDHLKELQKDDELDFINKRGEKQTLKHRIGRIEIL